MNKRIYILLLAFSSYIIVHGQNDIAPNGWEIIDSITGNLDGNTIKEKVIVYNTLDSSDSGKHREIRIFKKENQNWVLWKSSSTAMLNSNNGGMMGDPYGGIEIKNKVLSIHHSSGSSWKWSYTDKYRFQNDQFELIGYTSSNGKHCEEWAKLDFNISSGKINFTQEYQNCESEEQAVTKTEKETFYKKGVELTLKNRRFNEIEIISPKLKYRFFL